MIVNSTFHCRETSETKRKASSGFTFVELMVAMVLFGFIIIGSASTLNLASFQQRKVAMIRQAESVGLELIENFSAGNPGGYAPTGNDTAMQAYTAGRSKGGRFDQIYYRWTSTAEFNMQRLAVIVGFGRCTDGTTNCCTQTAPENCPNVLRLSSYY